MPRTSKADASRIESVEGILDARSEDLDGYITSFAAYLVDMDPAPLFQGLPDDRCQCPHWGYVIRGKMTFRFAGHEETYVAGDAYYAPPGHTPVMFAGAEVVEFSPAGEIADETTEVVKRNVAATARAENVPPARRFEGGPG